VKIDELPGQWVWIRAGSPLLFRSRADLPLTVPHDRVVKVERIQPSNETTPALAIWADTEGEYGVEARLVRGEVMSLAPSGSSPIASAADAIGRTIRRARDRLWRATGSK
jgi:hypothetical protein